MRLQDIPKWSVACFAVPCFAALHWQYLGGAIGARFSLRAADLNNLDLPSTVALTTTLTIVAWLLRSHGFPAWRHGTTFFYLGWLSGIPLLVAAISLRMNESYDLHVHHHTLGPFLFPICQFRTRPSLAAQAFVVGLSVEGISRWE